MAEGLSTVEHQRQESFPIESLRYAESKIGEFRKRLLEAAAVHAANRQPGADVYRVETEDIDAVLPGLLQTEIMEEDEQVGQTLH